MPDTDASVLDRPIGFRRSPAPIAYATAVTTMEAHVAAMHEGEADELLWLLEHPDVYTAGTSADAAELLDAGDVPVVRTGRGGRFTYHGPGQRIGYVMLDLKRRRPDVRCFVHDLEAWLIRALAKLDVVGERRAGRVGIWVRTPTGEAKIAAIGVRVRRWITYHGVALNVAPNLERFAGIVPCGLAGFGVTSLAALGRPTDDATVDAALRTAFVETFGRLNDVAEVDFGAPRR